MKSIGNKKERGLIISVKLSCLNFNIPPVQRGLVWEPGQVMHLWDSLSKGYPIGSFMAYGMPGRLELLDGQQRFNAIRMMGTTIEKCEDKQQATLWVRCDEDGNKPLFMVCTVSHPWGFTESGGVFTASEQAKANDSFLKYAGYEMKEFADCFRKADLKYGYPWLDEGRGFVPVPFLMFDDKENAWDTWNSQDVQNNSNFIYRFIPETSKTTFNKIYGSAWLKKIKNTGIPVIRWKNDNNVNVDELFTRINKGGTQLNSIDQRYSAICVYTGQEIKTKNNELAEKFLPPERLATLAARIACSAVKNQWIDDVSPDTIQKWFQEGNGKEKELLKISIAKGIWSV